MGRYMFSFVVSGFLYSAMIVSLLYATTNDDELTAPKKVEKINRVAVSIIQQQSHAKKVEPVKEIKKEKPKPKPKKVVKKTKPKPIIKEVVKKEEPKEEVVEEVQEQPVQEVVHEEVVDEQELQRQMQQMIAAKEKELDHFTRYLIKKINENKHYPMTARRRGIESDVNVKFIVMADGDVSGIEVLDGRRIFKKPSYKAIKKSFPVDVTNSVLEFPHEFQIKLEYKLVK